MTINKDTSRLEENHKKKNKQIETITGMPILIADNIDSETLMFLEIKSSTSE